MIYRLIFLSFLVFDLCQAQHLNAIQQHKLDSLNRLLETDISDTTRVNVLLGKFRIYWNTNDQEALKFNQQAFELANRINYPKGKYYTIHNKAALLITEGKYVESIPYLQEALLITEQHKLSKGKANVLYDLGVAYQRQGNHPKGLDYYFKVLKEVEKMPQDVSIRRKYCNTMQAIGTIYADQNDWDKALEYYKRSIAEAKKIDYKISLGYNYNGMGIIYMVKKNYQKAIEFYQQGLQMSLIVNNKNLEWLILSNIGELYHLQKQGDSCLKYHQRGIKLHEAVNDSTLLGTSTLGMAEAYLLKGDLEEALLMSQKSLYIANRLSSLSYLKDTYLIFGEIYKAKKQYQEALESFEKAKVLEDSLYNAEKHKQILQIQNQYDNYQKEQQILKQKYEIEDLKKQKKIGLLSLVLLLVAFLSSILIGVLFIRQKQLKNKKDKALMELEQALLKEEQLQTQLELSNTKQLLEYKEKELTSFTLNMIQKNQLLQDLKQQVEELIHKSEDKNMVQPLQKLKQNIQSNNQSDKQWENFKLAFEQVHKNFFHNLQQQCLDITPYDLKLAALLRLNFSSKEIATFLSISEDSVKKARYRLRKKLNLEKENNLVSFLMKIDEN